MFKPSREKIKAATQKHPARRVAAARGDLFSDNGTAVGDHCTCNRAGKHFLVLPCRD